MPISLIKRAVKGSALNVTEHDINLTAIETEVNVLETRTITTGTGLTGGGDLSANRTVALSAASIASLGQADSAVQPAALTSYATLASPAFTGNPVAPTQPEANNSTRLATTAFVTNKVATKANLVDGALAVGEIPQVVSISDPTGITGAFAIRNIVGISAADFDLINPNDFPTTTFLVND